MKKPCFAFLFATCLLAACADGGFSTGLPANQSLGTLSPTEANQLCSSTASYVASKSKMTTCQFEADLAAIAQGKTDADARMICKMKLTQCLAASTSGSGSGGTPSTGCQPPPASCMATVGEYEGCLNDVSHAYDQALAGMPNCDNLTLTISGLPSARPSPMTPVSCTKLENKCIGFSISIGSGTSAGGK